MGAWTSDWWYGGGGGFDCGEAGLIEFRAIAAGRIHDGADERFLGRGGAGGAHPEGCRLARRDVMNGGALKGRQRTAGRMVAAYMATDRGLPV